MKQAAIASSLTLATLLIPISLVDAQEVPPDRFEAKDAHLNEWRNIWERLWPTRKAEPARMEGPKIAREYGKIATFLIKEGDYHRGIDYLTRAIKSNPGDAGLAILSAKTEVELSQSALEHGTLQVRTMLRDRPEMALDCGELRSWAVGKFGGEGLGQTIDWDPSQPPANILARHGVPSGLRRGWIQVTSHDTSANARTFSGEELWRMAVFELFNINSACDFRQLHNELVRDGMTEKEYIRRMVTIELRAVQRTRALYCKIFLPWAQSKQFATAPAVWYTAAWDDGVAYERELRDTPYHRYLKVQYARLRR